MFSGMSSERLVDFFRQTPRDAIDATKVFDRGSLHPVEAAKLRQQLLAPRRPDAGDILKLGTSARLGPSRAMADDGEAVRLVAYFLYQVKARMVHAQL
jgi:hypothetical protein